MTTKEFSDGFDILVDSYRRFKDFDNKEIPDSIEFNEYEKSVCLTKAQEEIVIGLYNGTLKGEGFEQSEELRTYLHPLIASAKAPTQSNPDVVPFSLYKYVVDRLELINPLFIIYEEAYIDDNPCEKAIPVIPVRYDELSRVLDNPFRGPTKYKILRTDAYNASPERPHVFLYSKFKIAEYRIIYLMRPKPIILDYLPGGVTIQGSDNPINCELHPALHNMILERAVKIALNSKLNTIK